MRIAAALVAALLIGPPAGLVSARDSASPETTAVTIETLHYASTIDPALTDLRARVALPAVAPGAAVDAAAAPRLPILVLMHGFRLDASSFTDATYRRLASAGRGVIVVGVEMRGRAESSGRPDGGGREIHDLVDAVTAAEVRYASRVASGDVHLLGYSGGGANVLSAAGRFPDRFASVTAFFPIADYGYDRALGWFWQASAAQRHDLEDWIGKAPGSPAYASRAPLFAVTNFHGSIRLFHDREDTNVLAQHSMAMAEAARRAGLPVELSVSAATDAVRWKHGAPNGDAPVVQAEPRFLPDIVTPGSAAIVLPRRGRLAVAGYLVTRPFAVWLGDGSGARGWVDYDLDARRFDITYDAGDAPWQVALQGQPPGARLTMTINGRPIAVVSDGAGVASARAADAAATSPAAAPRPHQGV
jgi:pimeloyl-ACP methyl ester carboxylesterase